MAGEDADLHLPHYFELFGGFVFLEPLSHFEDRLRKATAALARDLMTEDPVTIEPDATGRRRGAADLALEAQPAPGGRARPARRRRHARRRARGADAGLSVLRALARIDDGAIERNCARLAAAAAPAALCAVVKADGYGHGAAAAARAALRPAARPGSRSPRPAEAAALRAAGIARRPLLVMGALVAGGAHRRRSAPRRTSSPGARASPPRSPRIPTAAGARVHVKLDTGMGRLGTRDAEEATAVAEAVAAAPGLELAGAMTHFATADDDPAFAREQLAALPALGARAPGAPSARSLLHAANSAATLRHPRVAPGPRPLRDRRSTAWTPSASRPTRTGSSRRSSCAPTSRRSSAIAPGESAGYGRRFVADARDVDRHGADRATPTACAAR